MSILVLRVVHVVSLCFRVGSVRQQLDLPRTADSPFSVGCLFVSVQPSELSLCVAGGVGVFSKVASRELKASASSGLWPWECRERPESTPSLRSALRRASSVEASAGSASSSRHQHCLHAARRGLAQLAVKGGSALAHDICTKVPFVAEAVLYFLKDRVTRNAAASDDAKLRPLLKISAEAQAMVRVYAFLQRATAKESVEAARESDGGKGRLFKALKRALPLVDWKALGWRSAIRLHLLLGPELLENYQRLEAQTRNGGPQQQLLAVQSLADPSASSAPRWEFCDLVADAGLRGLEKWGDTRVAFKHPLILSSLNSLSVPIVSR